MYVSLLLYLTSSSITFPWYVTHLIAVLIWRYISNGKNFEISVIKYHSLSSAIATSYFTFLIRATRCQETDLEHVSSILLQCLLFFVSVFIFAFPRVASNSACSSRGEKFYRVNTQYKISGKNQLEKRRHVSRRARHVLQIESTRIDDTALTANTSQLCGSTDGKRYRLWHKLLCPKRAIDWPIDRLIDDKPIINCTICTV